MNAPTPLATPIPLHHPPVTLSRADRVLMDCVSIQVEPQGNGWTAWVLDAANPTAGLEPSVIAHTPLMLTPGDAFDAGMQAYLRELSVRQDAEAEEARETAKAEHELDQHERSMQGWGR